MITGKKDINSLNQISVFILRLSAFNKLKLCI